MLFLPWSGEGYLRSRSQLSESREWHRARGGAHDRRPRLVRAGQRCAASMVSHVAEEARGRARFHLGRPSSWSAAAIAAAATIEPALNTALTIHDIRLR